MPATEYWTAQVVNGERVSRGLGKYACGYLGLLLSNLAFGFAICRS